MFFKVFVLTCLMLSCTEGGKILGIFPMPGISHYILSSKLMKGLIEDGHDVVMVSPYAMKNPPKNGKYTDIILEGFVEEFQRLSEKIDLLEHRKVWHTLRTINMMSQLVSLFNETLYNASLMKLVDSQAQFDAVIIEEFLNDALKVYGHLFNCPLIILSSIGPNPKINAIVSNPQPVSYVAHMNSKPFSSDISLLDRFMNLIQYVINALLSTFSKSKNNDILHSIYPDAPSIDELEKNVALVLLNSHISINEPQALVPNMVEIGGFFIDPPKALPQDIKEYMDNATNGVIYFSMGSYLKSKNLPEERKMAFFNIFGRLKQRIIWKFEEDLPNKPSNVLIKKWCPQQDILAHPNIKLFITHGGLLSTTETVYHGVPILAIPVFADQPSNAAKAVANGYALQLDYSSPEFTEEKLEYLINELLTNPSYKEVAQNKSRIFHDRPMKPMETAIYWVNYVLRHRGAPHLMIAGSKLAWYKFYMVDVAVIVVLILVATLYIWKIVIKIFFNCIRKKTTNKQKVS